MEATIPLIVPYELYQEYEADICFARFMGWDYPTFEQWLATR